MIDAQTLSQPSRRYRSINNHFLFTPHRRALLENGQGRKTLPASSTTILFLGRRKLFQPLFYLLQLCFQRVHLATQQFFFSGGGSADFAILLRHKTISRLHSHATHSAPEAPATTKAAKTARCTGCARHPGSRTKSRTATGHRSISHRPGSISSWHFSHLSILIELYASRRRYCHMLIIIIIKFWSYVNNRSKKSSAASIQPNFLHDYLQEGSTAGQISLFRSNRARQRLRLQ